MITFRKHSGLYTLEVEQVVPVSMEAAWAFFSDPANLANITPREMGFSVTSKNTGSAYPGQIITYKVGIFPIIKSNWVTEITHVKENKYFIDEQRFGPYKMWHHEHWFTQVEGGVLMTDRVSYKLPFGFVGAIAQILFVKNKLTKIFNHRHQSILDYFAHHP